MDGIKGVKSAKLRGKTVLLCVCGSVAAIESPKLAHELIRHGADVFAVMSPEAQRVIHPNVMEWATGNPVVTELTGKAEHVTLTEKADVILVAPATANTIGKAAYAIDDTPVTSVLTMAIGSRKKIIVAPAMHGAMNAHPVVKENIARLKKLGIVFAEPRIEEGKAKMADISDIAALVIKG